MAPIGSSPAAGLAIRLHFQALDGSLRGERVFRKHPLRLGRNAVNDCSLAHRFVSDFHALIELVEGELCVRDLNSRNGVASQHMMPLPPNRAVRLAEMGNVFVLGRAVEVRVETFEDNAANDRRVSSVRGSVLGNPEAMAGFAIVADLASLPGVAPLPALSFVDPSFVARPPSAPAAMPERSMGDASLPPLGSVGSIDGYRPPASANRHAEGRRAAARPAGPPGGAIPGTQHLRIDMEALALLGLRELAASLVPGAELETTGDVARLLTKLHDAVEVFCRFLPAMRDGRLPLASGVHDRRPGTPSAIERADDPARMASALLDWRDHVHDAPAQIECILADVVMQQAALTDAVTRGVDALLEELSPDRIEQHAAQEPSLGAAFGRSRACWLAFKERFEQLTEQRRFLGLVFGLELAARARSHDER